MLTEWFVWFTVRSFCSCRNRHKTVPAPRSKVPETQCLRSCKWKVKTDLQWWEAHWYLPVAMSMWRKMAQKQWCQGQNGLWISGVMFTGLHCKALWQAITLFKRRTCNWVGKDWQQSRRSWNSWFGTNQRLRDPLIQVRSGSAECLCFHWGLFRRTRTRTLWSFGTRHILMVNLANIWSFFQYDSYCYNRHARWCLSHHIINLVKSRYRPHKLEHIFLTIQD